jgi:ribulose-phosphate 3-epimerase
MYYPEVKIAPSILAADYSRLGEEIKDVERRGVDLIHIDVMDGHFVPNITIGPDMVRDIRKVTNLPFDVHLMIQRPDLYIQRFIDAGADIITFHIEPFMERGKLNLKKLKRTYRKAKNVKAGLVLNPNTSIRHFKLILNELPLDFILVMSVNPGFGGQSFIPDVLEKVRVLRGKFNFKGDIEIDGGINKQTAKLAVEAGCNILVAGTYIFRAKDRTQAIAALRELERRLK